MLRIIFLFFSVVFFQGGRSDEVIPAEHEVSLEEFFCSSTQLFNQSTNHLINHSTIQPVNQSTHQPVNYLTNQPIN
jgi:hypothetical protein